MKYKEFGSENKNVIILLHGGGLSWWNHKEAAEQLSARFHVILPILDGHAGSDRSFASIEDNAEEIIAFIDRHFGSRVLMIGGLSLGGQVLLEILSRRSDICQYALIESAPCLPSRITAALIPPIFGCCQGLIRRKWFSRLQFRSLHIKNEHFEAYYRDSCAITKDNLIAFMRANTAYSLKESIRYCQAETHIFVGARENRAMLRSAKIMGEHMAGSKVRILSGMHHGNFSINYPSLYAQTVMDIVRDAD